MGRPDRFNLNHYTIEDILVERCFEPAKNIVVIERDQGLMKRIDRLHLEMPYAGARMLRDLLALEDIHVGRKHVATLMRRMSIEALYRKPRTTRKHPQHRVYPYLLRGLTIDRPNQVWAMDITYIPMARGFVYLLGINMKQIFGNHILKNTDTNYDHNQTTAYTLEQFAMSELNRYSRVLAQ